MEKLRPVFPLPDMLKNRFAAELHTSIHDFAVLSRFITDVEWGSDFWTLHKWTPNLAPLKRLSKQA